ncbi:MAG: hypothetical protein QE280_04595 [Caulobacter sp.]|nr:hypothetical protein [Caulobacter sp.]
MPKTPVTAARRSRSLLMSALAASLAAGGILGLVTVVAGPPAAWLVGVIYLVGFGGAAWLSLLWWGSIDEGVREAHKSSWYWGGSSGLVLVVAAFHLLHFVDPATPLDRFAMIPGDAGLIVTGIALTAGVQLAGYLLFWAGWWLRHGR